MSNLPQNTALLDLLRAQAVLEERGAYADEGWESHTHPDLVERLQQLAPGRSVLACGDSAKGGKQRGRGRR